MPGGGEVLVGSNDRLGRMPVALVDDQAAQFDALPRGASLGVSGSLAASLPHDERIRASWALSCAPVAGVLTGCEALNYKVRCPSFGLHSGLGDQDTLAAAF